MKADVRRGLSEVFKNGDEDRLRAPLRFGVALVLLFLFAIPLGLTAFVIGLIVGDLGPVATVLGETFSLLALAGAVVAIVWVVDRRYLHDIGLAIDRPFASALFFGGASGVAMVGVVVLTTLLAGGTLARTVSTSDGDLFAGMAVPIGLLVAFGFFFALAALEELLFRGYILVNVAEGSRMFTDERTAVLSGVGVSGALFGIAHAANPGASLLSVFNIVLFGLLLGGAFVLTESLAIPIGVHTTWNFALGPVFGLPVSGLTSGVTVVGIEPGGPELLTGGAFGPEGGLAVIPALAVGALLLFLWVRHTGGEWTVNEQVAKPDLRSQK